MKGVKDVTSIYNIKQQCRVALGHIALVKVVLGGKKV